MWSFELSRHTNVVLLHSVSRWPLKFHHPNAMIRNIPKLAVMH